MNWSRFCLEDRRLGRGSCDLRAVTLVPAGASTTNSALTRSASAMPRLIGLAQGDNLLVDERQVGDLHPHGAGLVARLVAPRDGSPGGALRLVQAPGGHEPHPHRGLRHRHDLDSNHAIDEDGLVLLARQNQHAILPLVPFPLVVHEGIGGPGGARTQSASLR